MIFGIFHFFERFKKSKRGELVKICGEFEEKCQNVCIKLIAK